MLLSNLMSRLVNGGVMASGDVPPLSNDGVLWTDRYYTMHVGQIDLANDGLVRQSVILPQDTRFRLTKINSAFSAVGAMPLVSYQIDSEVLPEFDMSSALTYNANLYSLLVPEDSNYLLWREHDSDASAGGNAGGCVLRNAAGHIIRNFGPVPGVSLESNAGTVFSSEYFDESGRWDSRPVVLTQGPYAGKIASPILSNGGNAKIQIVDAEQQWYATIDDVVAEVDAIELFNQPHDSSGAFCEHLDGSIVVVRINSTRTQLLVTKHTPSSIVGAGSAISATLTIPVTLFESHIGYRLRVMRLDNGNFFISWHHSPNYAINGYDGTHYASVNFCIVAADLSTTLVAPSNIEPTSTSAQWNQEVVKLASGDLFACWFEINNPTLSDPSVVTVRAKVLSQSGSTLVAAVTVRDFSSGLGGLSGHEGVIDNPVSYATAMTSVNVLNNGSVAITSAFRGIGYDLWLLDIVSATTLASIASRLMSEFVNPSLDSTMSIESAKRFFSVIAVGDQLYVAGKHFIEHDSVDVYALAKIDSDGTVLAFQQVLSGAVSQSVNYDDGAPLWLTYDAVNGWLRLDVIKYDGGPKIYTNLIDMQTLQTLVRYDDGYALMYLTAGQYYVDARQEWDNIALRLAKIAPAQADSAAEFYGAHSTAHLSQGTTESPNKNRFFVEFNSDSFLFGSGFDNGYISEAGSLCRLAIDVVRIRDDKPITFGDVGYIDLNAAGSYSQPELITDLALRDGDVIQIRQVNLVGGLLNQFKIAEATVTMVGEALLPLWI